MSITVVMAFLVSLPAGARDTAKERLLAEALFDDALERIGDEDYASACPRLEESYRLDPAIGTLLYLAHCYRSLGKTASAWITFRHAASAAREAAQAEREKIAEQSASELRPQLTRLRLAHQGSLPAGFVLRLDGYELPATALDVPVPVDPGIHVVEATAPGHRRWDKRIELPRESKTFEVVVPTLQAAPAPPPKPVQPEEQPSNPTRPILGWLLTGIGAGSIGAGAAVAASDGSELMAGVLLGVGGVSLGAGSLLLLLPRASPRPVDVAAAPTHGGGAVVVSGTW